MIRGVTACPIQNRLTARPNPNHMHEHEILREIAELSARALHLDTFFDGFRMGSNGNQEVDLTHLNPKDLIKDDPRKFDPVGGVEPVSDMDWLEHPELIRMVNRKFNEYIHKEYGFNPHFAVRFPFIFMAEAMEPEVLKNMLIYEALKALGVETPVVVQPETGAGIECGAVLISMVVKMLFANAAEDTGGDTAKYKTIEQGGGTRKPLKTGIQMMSQAETPSTVYKLGCWAKAGRKHLKFDFNEYDEGGKRTGRQNPKGYGVVYEEDADGNRIKTDQVCMIDRNGNIIYAHTKTGSRHKISVDDIHLHKTKDWGGEHRDAEIEELDNSELNGAGAGRRGGNTVDEDGFQVARGAKQSKKERDDEDMDRINRELDDDDALEKAYGNAPSQFKTNPDRGFKNEGQSAGGRRKPGKNMPRSSQTHGEQGQGDDNTRLADVYNKAVSYVQGAAFWRGSSDRRWNLVVSGGTETKAKLIELKKAATLSDAKKSEENKDSEGAFFRCMRQTFEQEETAFVRSMGLSLFYENYEEAYTEEEKKSDARIARLFKESEIAIELEEKAPTEEGEDASTREQVIDDLKTKCNEDIDKEREAFQESMELAKEEFEKKDNNLETRFADLLRSEYYEYIETSTRALLAWRNKPNPDGDDEPVTEMYVKGIIRDQPRAHVPDNTDFFKIHPSLPKEEEEPLAKGGRPREATITPGKTGAESIQHNPAKTKRFTRAPDFFAAFQPKKWESVAPSADLAKRQKEEEKRLDKEVSKQKDIAIKYVETSAPDLIPFFIYEINNDATTFDTWVKELQGPEAEKAKHDRKILLTNSTYYDALRQKARESKTEYEVSKKGPTQGRAVDAEKTNIERVRLESSTEGLPVYAYIDQELKKDELEYNYSLVHVWDNQDEYARLERAHASKIATSEYYQDIYRRAYENMKLSDPSRLFDVDSTPLFEKKAEEWAKARANHEKKNKNKDAKIEYDKKPHRPEDLTGEQALTWNIGIKPDGLNEKQTARWYEIKNFSINELKFIKEYKEEFAGAHHFPKFGEFTPDDRDKAAIKRERMLLKIWSEKPKKANTSSKTDTPTHVEKMAKSYAEGKVKEEYGVLEQAYRDADHNWRMNKAETELKKILEQAKNTRDAYNKEEKTKEYVQKYLDALSDAKRYAIWKIYEMYKDTEPPSEDKQKEDFQTCITDYMRAVDNAETFVRSTFDRECCNDVDTMIFAEKMKEKTVDEVKKVILEEETESGKISKAELEQWRAQRAFAEFYSQTRDDMTFQFDVGIECAEVYATRGFGLLSKTNSDGTTTAAYTKKFHLEVWRHVLTELQTFCKCWIQCNPTVPEKNKRILTKENPLSPIDRTAVEITSGALIFSNKSLVELKNSVLGTNDPDERYVLCVERLAKRDSLFELYIEQAALLSLDVQVLLRAAAYAHRLFQLAVKKVDAEKETDAEKLEFITGIFKTLCRLFVDGTNAENVGTAVRNATDRLGNKLIDEIRDSAASFGISLLESVHRDVEETLFKFDEDLQQIRRRTRRGDAKRAEETKHQLDEKRKTEFTWFVDRVARKSPPWGGKYSEERFKQWYTKTEKENDARTKGFQNFATLRDARKSYVDCCELCMDNADKLMIAEVSSTSIADEIYGKKTTSFTSMSKFAMTARLFYICGTMMTTGSMSEEELLLFRIQALFPLIRKTKRDYSGMGQSKEAAKKQPKSEDYKTRVEKMRNASKNEANIAKTAAGFVDRYCTQYLEKQAYFYLTLVEILEVNQEDAKVMFNDVVEKARHKVDPLDAAMNATAKTLKIMEVDDKKLKKYTVQDFREVLDLYFMNSFWILYSENEKELSTDMKGIFKLVDVDPNMVDNTKAKIAKIAALKGYLELMWSQREEAKNKKEEKEPEWKVIPTQEELRQKQKENAKEKKLTAKKKSAAERAERIRAAVKAAKQSGPGRRAATKVAPKSAAQKEEERVYQEQLIDAVTTVQNVRTWAAVVQHVQPQAEHADTAESTHIVQNVQPKAEYTDTARRTLEKIKLKQAAGKWAVSRVKKEHKDARDILSMQEQNNPTLPASLDALTAVQEDEREGGIQEYTNLYLENFYRADIYAKNQVPANSTSNITRTMWDDIYTEYFNRYMNASVVERYRMTWNVEGSDNLQGPDQPNAHLPQADVPSTDGGMEEDETEPARTSTGSRFTLSAGVHLGVVSPDVQRDIDALEKEGLKHPQAGYFGGRDQMLQNNVTGFCTHAKEHITRPGSNSERAERGRAGKLDILGQNVHNLDPYVQLEHGPIPDFLSRVRKWLQRNSPTAKVDGKLKTDESGRPWYEIDLYDINPAWKLDYQTYEVEPKEMAKELIDVYVRPMWDARIRAKIMCFRTRYPWSRMEKHVVGKSGILPHYLFLGSLQDTPFRTAEATERIRRPDMQVTRHGTSYWHWVYHESLPVPKKLIRSQIWIPSENWAEVYFSHNSNYHEWKELWHGRGQHQTKTKPALKDTVVIPEFSTNNTVGSSVRLEHHTGVPMCSTSCSLSLLNRPRYNLGLLGLSGRMNGRVTGRRFRRGGVKH